MQGRLLWLFAAFASSGVHHERGGRIELKTELIAQQTPSWCWAATASMALKLRGFPDINPGSNYQCGVVAAAFPECDDDCSRCDEPLGTMISFVGLLNRYRDLALSLSRGPVPQLSPDYVAHPGLARIKRSLDLSYPVIAGISPGAAPALPEDAAHAVLITGYRDDYLGSGEPWVMVRDPYPYPAGGNPWVNAGYSFANSTGKVLLPWRELRDRMNLSSAVFLVKLGSRSA